MIRLLQDDCKVRMASMDENSIDAVVCDPPYYLTAITKGSPRQHDGGTKTTAKGFMGRAWDGDGLAHSPEFWQIVFRILKPGGIVKAFAGTRTFHNMAWAMESAGFQNLDLEAWCYATGFPKSMDIGKQIDKMKGLKRESKKMEFTGNALMRHGGDNTRPWMEEALKNGYHELPGNTPACAESELWNGWGTALKPAWEPIMIGYKPR